MATTKTNRELASSIHQAARSWLQSHREAYRSDRGQWPNSAQEMLDAGRQDARDLHALARLVGSGKLAEARRFADGLDTIVRDNIPQDAWDKLHREES